MLCTKFELMWGRCAYSTLFSKKNSHIVENLDYIIVENNSPFPSEYHPLFFRSDGDGAFKAQFKEHFKSNVIIHEVSMPCTPAQNGRNTPHHLPYNA